MAEGDTAPGPAQGQGEGEGEGQQGPPAGDTPTLAKVSEKVDQLAETVSRFIGAAHTGSQDAVQQRLDSPGAVAAQVRDELARADRERQAADLQTKVESTAATVKELAEKPPAPPLRRVTRVMFGKNPDQ